MTFERLRDWVEAHGGTAYRARWDDGETITVRLNGNLYRESGYSYETPTASDVIARQLGLSIPAIHSLARTFTAKDMTGEPAL